MADFPLFINGNPVICGAATRCMANVLYTATETDQDRLHRLRSGAATAPPTARSRSRRATTRPAPSPTTTSRPTSRSSRRWTTTTAVTLTEATGPSPLPSDRHSRLQPVRPSLRDRLNEGALRPDRDHAAGYAAGAGRATAPRRWHDHPAPRATTTTCTITNDDVAPKLTLVKIVDNDNGGNALPR